MATRVKNYDDVPQRPRVDTQPENKPLSNERMVPHNIPMEESLLGSIIFNGDIFGEITAKINRNDFFLERHSLVWDAMKAIHDRGQSIDDLTVYDELDSQGLMEKLGVSFITYLVKNVATYVNAGTYADMLRNHAIRRKGISVLEEAMRAFQSNDMTTIKALKHVADLINPMIGEYHRGELQASSFKDVLSEVYSEAQEWNDDKRTVRGWHLGIPAVDEALGGIENGTLTGVIAHTGQGKSTLMGQAILALAQQGAGLICPTEMPKEQYVLRLLAYHAGTTGSVLRKGQGDDDVWERVTQSYADLSLLPLTFIPGKPTPSQLLTLAKDYQKLGKCDWIVIDGLHDMRPDNRGDSIYERITDIMEGVHRIAVELSIPVFFTLHVSRGASDDMSKPPRIQQALGSSRIEQLLAQCLVLWRPGGLVESGALSRLPDGYGMESTDIIIAKSRLEKTGARLKMRLVQNGHNFGFWPEPR